MSKIRIVQTTSLTTDGPIAGVKGEVGVDVVAGDSHSHGVVLVSVRHYSAQVKSEDYPGHWRWRLPEAGAVAVDALAQLRDIVQLAETEMVRQGLLPHTQDDLLRGALVRVRGMLAEIAGGLPALADDFAPVVEAIDRALADVA